MAKGISRHQALADLIHELGYRAKIDGETITTGMSGFIILIIYKNDDSIQMHFGITLDDSGFTIEDANEFNKKYRFVKCYISDDAAAFEHDFLFDINSEDAKNRLEKIFLIWESSIDVAMEALESANNRHADDSTVQGDDSTTPDVLKSRHPSA